MTSVGFSKSVWLSFWISSILTIVGLCQIGLHIYAKGLMHPSIYLSNCLLWSGMLTIGGASGNFLMSVGRIRRGPVVIATLYSVVCFIQIASLTVSEVFEWRLNQLLIVPESMPFEQLAFHCRYVYLLSTGLTGFAVVISFVGAELAGFVLIAASSHSRRGLPSSTRSFLLGRLSGKTARSWLYVRGRSSTPRSSVTRRDIMPKSPSPVSFPGSTVKSLGTIGSKVLLVAPPNRSGKKSRPTVITTSDLQSSAPLKMIAAIRPSVFRRDSDVDVNGNRVKSHGALEPEGLNVVSLSPRPEISGISRGSDVYF